MTQYDLKMADTGQIRTEELSEEEWFKVFVSGYWQGRPLQYIERVGAPSKHVDFAEHLDGSKSS